MNTRNNNDKAPNEDTIALAYRENNTHVFMHEGNRKKETLKINCLI